MLSVLCAFPVAFAASAQICAAVPPRAVPCRPFCARFLSPHAARPAPAAISCRCRHLEAFFSHCAHDVSDCPRTVSVLLRSTGRILTHNSAEGQIPTLHSLSAPRRTYLAGRELFVLRSLKYAHPKRVFKIDRQRAANFIHGAAAPHLLFPACRHGATERLSRPAAPRGRYSCKHPPEMGQRAHSSHRPHRWHSRTRDRPRRP